MLAYDGVALIFQHGEFTIELRIYMFIMSVQNVEFSF